MSGSSLISSVSAEVSCIALLHVTVGSCVTLLHLTVGPFFFTLLHVTVGSCLSLLHVTVGPCLTRSHVTVIQIMNNVFGCKTTI